MNVMNCQNFNQYCLYINRSNILKEDYHFLVRNQLEKQPVVDRLVDSFLAVTSGEAINQPSTYDLTHDIDFLFRYPSALSFFRALAGTLYRSEGWPSLLRPIWMRV